MIPATEKRLLYNPVPHFFTTMIIMIYDLSNIPKITSMDNDNENNDI